MTGPVSLALKHPDVWSLTLAVVVRVISHPGTRGWWRGGMRGMQRVRGLGWRGEEEIKQLDNSEGPGAGRWAGRCLDSMLATH